MSSGLFGGPGFEPDPFEDFLARFFGELRPGTVVRVDVADGTLRFTSG